jgi:hypothetical protein
MVHGLACTKSQSIDQSAIDKMSAIRQGFRSLPLATSKRIHLEQMIQELSHPRLKQGGTTRLPFPRLAPAVAVKSWRNF